MKKKAAVILLTVGVLGLLLFDLWESKPDCEAMSVTGRQETTAQEKEGPRHPVTESVKDDRRMNAWKSTGTAALAEEDMSVKKIALTFDDGPHPHYTEQLLDGLAEREVHASFFVTGEHAKLHPEVIERMNQEGHLIGNHTYSHMQLREGRQEEFKEELIKTNEVIREITGEEVLYVRPPYGTWDKSFEEELNMFPVLWTIDPLDWCSHNADCISRKVVEKAKENSIILMHDEYESTVTAALNIVDELQKKGYVFVTVEEILFD